jgi:hypothetical protein
MKYFNSIPKISTSDNNGNSIVLTNLLARVDIKQSLLRNPSLFYQYDLQEGDTPEIVAAKYYGDSYRYWLVLFANETMDPEWDWPLSSSQFDAYLKDKYGNISHTTSTTKEYRKTVLTIDSTTLEESIETIVIDETTYNGLATGTTSQTFGSGATVTQTVTKSEVSIYDYELEKNESKRKIYIINSIFTSQIESQFKSLMGR